MKSQRVRFAVWLAAAFMLGAAASVLLAYNWREPRIAGDTTSVTALKARFRRPAAVPFPESNDFSAEKAALGERLFHDPALSRDGTIACATCHRRDHGLADARSFSTGVPGQPLARHTPALWNLAWGRFYFWDGRARSLEEQVQSPIEARDEMAQPLDALARRLAADEEYAGAFSRVFPGDGVTPERITQALATYVRTLVSPESRFDRWIEGEEKALTPQEVKGFRLFNGKAGCANCHAAWNFTDQAFYDIGLPGDDRGRGAVLRLDAAEHAFKTPSLRQAALTAPYMHDGSLATLSDVLRHYEHGIVNRPTLPPDLRRSLGLSPDERAALLAFLVTLTAPGGPPRPAAITPVAIEPAEPAVRVHTITQSEKTFHPRHVELRAGQRLWILNNDIRTHNVRVFDPALDYDSGPQEPGETVQIDFRHEGSFLVFCGIHPTMELWVDVRR